MVKLGEVIQKQGLRKAKDALRLLKDGDISHEVAEKLVVLACKNAKDNKRGTVLERDVEGLLAAYKLGTAVH